MDVKLSPSNLVLDHLDIVIAGVLVVAHTHLFHYLNRRQIFRLGYGQNVIEFVLLKSVSKAGSDQFGCQSASPVALREMIYNFGCTHQRAQSAISNKGLSLFINRSPSAKSVALPMSNDAL